MQTRYPSSIREEELKNKVAADFFAPNVYEHGFLKR